MRSLKNRARVWLAVLAAAVASVCALALMPAAAADAASTAPATAAAGSLPACPFWGGDITPPPRSVTSFTPPKQTAQPVDFSSRKPAPTLSGTMTEGQETLTVGRVPGAVAYEVWRDGVRVGYISYWGQTGPLTVVDKAPCQNAYYDAVALFDQSGSDASMGRLSAPYWLQDDGSIATGPGDVAPGTKISMTVTSYNDGGQTASGYTTQIGVCATDPRVIPWGTYFTVPDYGTCYAADIGTWIQNDTVDLWLPGSQAYGWGVQHRTVTVIADPFGGSTPPPSGSPTPTTSPTPTPTAGACAAAWADDRAYSLGEKVSYDGHDWTATQWSWDEPPGGSAHAWKDDGACAKP